MQRWIIHIDMDAFYASVEQRDQPEYRGKPVIVGGISVRGVVSAASYEARRFGVHSAMPMVQAKRLCPQGIFLFPDHRKYADISRQIHTILSAFSPLVEPLSLDEAFLDVSGMNLLADDPVQLARQIKQRIREELDLIASAGVAPNKFLAKLASDLGKPDGLFVVRYGEEKNVLENLPIRRLWGVGETTAQVLKKLRVETIGQLAKMEVSRLEPYLGKMAFELKRLACGVDERPVVPEAAAKSIGRENTFEQNLTDRTELLSHLLEMSEQVGRRLRHSLLAGRTVTVKVRFASFRTITRSRTVSEPTCLDDEIYKIVRDIFNGVILTEGVRLLGVTVSHLSEGMQTASLFGMEEQEKKQAVYKAIDKLKDRFGEDIVRHGGVLPRQRDN